VDKRLPGMTAGRNRAGMLCQDVVFGSKAHLLRRSERDVRLRCATNLVGPSHFLDRTLLPP
jgi:hypothetical protein